MKYLGLILASIVLLSFCLTKEPYSKVGTASYYGNKLDGRRTYSGQIYRKDSMVCAHPYLKMGTILRVTNLKNDSVVVVKVIDRMGCKTREVDLSYAAAKKLNFLKAGLAKVRVDEVLPLNSLNKE